MVNDKIQTGKGGGQGDFSHLKEAERPCRFQMKKWKTCIPAPFLNCEYVYPIQQKKVKALVDHLSQNQNVEKIILFGSSVTAQCHIGSDVDIFVKLKKNEYPLSKAFHFVFDLWTNFSVDERMYEEILKKGVIVYDRGYSAS